MRATASGKSRSPGSPILGRWSLGSGCHLELDDAVHAAILALKEMVVSGGFGQLAPDRVEIGILEAHGFRRLGLAEVKDFLCEICDSNKFQRNISVSN